MTNITLDAFTICFCVMWIDQVEFVISGIYHRVETTISAGDNLDCIYELWNFRLFLLFHFPSIQWIPLLLRCFYRNIWSLYLNNRIDVS
jgi:hypothetical protein